MTLNLDAGGNAPGTEGNASSQLAPKKPAGLNLGLPLEISTARGSADLVDVELPLERQGWVAQKWLRRNAASYFENRNCVSRRAVALRWLESR